MKKITLLLTTVFSIAFCHLLLAQSQRMVLVEEFTQASCGPCAAQNPTFNTLLDGNLSKVIPIKYQTSWPGVDPMNAQTASEVANRVTYYNVTGVPTGLFDGVELTGGSYTGAPANASQAKINTEYGVSSPFTMTLSHSFSSVYDSVYITLNITCSQAFTASGSSNLKARVGLVEKIIDFCAAPGSNGETEFKEVMRKMYPDADGTTLSGTWTLNQTQNLTFSAALPSYVYDKNNIAIVAWIQDDGDKSVQQAAYSAPQQLPVDAGLHSCAAGSVISCNTTVNPAVHIHNYGANSLTACTVNWQVDGGSVSSQPWSGNLASGGTALVSLPSINLTQGSHTLHFYTTNPGGSADHNTNNDSWNMSANILSTPVPSPITQNFASGAYPPTGWIRENVDGDGYQWARSSASNPSSGSGSSVMQFYYAAAGTIDNLYAPIFDFSAAGATAYLSFDLAHAYYTNNPDELKVNISTDCGATWTTAYDKTDPSLSTVTYTTGSWTPAASNWRTEIVNMAPYAGQHSVLVQFQAISGYGNNLYIDNVNIANLVGINEVISSKDVNVYPNPTSGLFTVKVDLQQSSNLTITVTNPIGETIKTINEKNVSSGSYPVDLSKEAKGNYFVSIKTDEGSITKRVSVTE